MKITAIGYSLSEDPSTLKEWKANLISEIRELVKNGSEIILYPELFLLGTGRYFKNSSPVEELKNVARFIEEDLLPSLQIKEEVLLVLGTGPRIVAGKIYNSAPVFCSGKWHFQDKLFLTPWEPDFTPGFESNVFRFKEFKTAVVICFDSEQPDLSMKLKEEGIDLMLVPSATTNENGSNRVNRCSSARAVELGACVMTSLLIGDSPCDLIDHNEGRLGFYLPAQEDVKLPQEKHSEYSKEKKIIQHWELDVEMMKRVKLKSSETKPYHKAFNVDLRIKSMC